jgi:hypothetical protein
MLKLYANINDKIHYWETWDKDDNSATIHWGELGERGQNKDVKGGLFKNFRKVVQEEIDQKIKEGYGQVDEEDLVTLEVVYKIKDMGTESDLTKRHNLESRLNETLGWTGLGYVDGGSIGSGEMEVCCLVVDFETAKQVIEKDLKGTEFSNFDRIQES